MKSSVLLVILAACSLSVFAGHHEKGQAGKGEGVCQDYGPQTPRDIDNAQGENPVKFSLAPPSSEMNLCNIHFHKNAEHRAKAFPHYAGDLANGESGGYQCSMSKNLSTRELRPVTGEVCKGLKPGDTIEVHWVHTSCAVAPGPGLGSCLSDKCATPNLRVETQVFTLVNDSGAMDFASMDYASAKKGGYHQAKFVPDSTGTPVEFLGSTTGPKYTEQSCSPLQVTWSVRPQCAKLDINSVAKWCESNPFEEDHAHGVRRLVTDERLLSEIR